MDKLIIAVIIAAIGAWAGWDLRGDHEAATQLKATQAGIKKTDEGQTKVDALDANQSRANAVQAGKDRIITKEVIRYVQVTPAADRVVLPGTWRLRHDAAATGTPTEPASLASGTADPIDDAPALETVADNYAGCRHAIGQVKGWQDWWATAKDYCGQP